MLAVLLLPLLAAAPVPADRRDPDPPRLTAADLKGSWSYSWGGYPDGWVWFDGRGRYAAQHCPPHGPLYSGLYAVEDGRAVVLTEWSLYPDGREHGSCEYRLTLDPGPHGVLSGGCWSTPVRLARFLNGGVWYGRLWRNCGGGW